MLQAAIPCIVLVVLFFLPESPRWLAYNGRHEEALDVLARVAGEDRESASIQVQFREIVDTFEYEKHVGRGVGFREAARIPANRKRVFLAMSVAPLCMMSGSNVITLVATFHSELHFAFLVD